MSIKLLRLISTVLMLIMFMPEIAQAGEKEITTLIEPQMTLQKVSEINHIELDKLISLGDKLYSSNTTVQQIMIEKSISIETFKAKIHDLQLESNLEQSKDWFKIKLKFAFWTVFIISSIILLAKHRKKKNTYKIRKLFLIAAVIIFGVWLGSDPNPLGTVNDALVLYGQEGIIFKPRLVALTIFLLTVVLGGRLLCGWGCQLGTLQEVLYQLPIPKYRIPFKLSNIIRIVFFITMTTLALGWGFDLIGIIDPFKIFSFQPGVFLGSTITVAVILILSLFIYRPWCQILCPFGLLAWLVEKFSYFRIRVDKKNCLNCGLCHNVCPTGSIDAKHFDMSKIDCFNCSLCIDSCPAEAISYSKKKKVSKLSEKSTYQI